jgi:protein disulfide-isomerase-like protein
MNTSLRLAVALLLAAASHAAVTSLDDANYDEITMGVPVFIKFFAPWCGHCKAMAADWERLAEDFSGNTPANGISALIAEVDCTADNTVAICDLNNVEGFPTLKYGDANDLEEYEGGRSYEELSEFATEHLKPSCSPSNLDICDQDQREAINMFSSMSLGDLGEAVANVVELMQATEEEREDGIDQIQDAYEELMDEYDEKLRSIKREAKFDLLRSVFIEKGGGGLKNPEDAIGNDDDFGDEF